MVLAWCGVALIALGLGTGGREAARRLTPIEKAGAYLAGRGAAREVRRSLGAWGWSGGLLAGGGALLLLAWRAGRH